MAATKEQIKELQRNLKSMGLYLGNIDGLWGPASHGAFVNARRKAYTLSKPQTTPDGINETLFAYCKAPAWSNSVSDLFLSRTKTICDQLGMGWQGADQLMACMAFETRATFSPTIKNGAGAPYYGIIQFGAAAAKDAGTTIPALLKMSAEEQLTYVYNFFKPYANKLKTLSDVYMRILLPSAVGKPEDFVLFDRDGAKPIQYTQNKGLDINKDGKITKAEAAAHVEQKMVEGLNPKNLRVS